MVSSVLFRRGRGPGMWWFCSLFTGVAGGGVEEGGMLRSRPTIRLLNVMRGAAWTRGADFLCGLLRPNECTGAECPQRGVPRPPRGTTISCGSDKQRERVKTNATERTLWGGALPTLRAPVGRPAQAGRGPRVQRAANGADSDWLRANEAPPRESPEGAPSIRHCQYP